MGTVRKLKSFLLSDQMGYIITRDYSTSHGYTDKVKNSAMKLRLIYIVGSATPSSLVNI